MASSRKDATQSNTDIGVQTSSDDSEAVTYTIESLELVDSVNQKIRALKNNNWYIRGDKQAWLRDIAASDSLTINGARFDEDAEYSELSDFDRNHPAVKAPIARKFTKRVLFNGDEELYKRHYNNLANNHNQRAATFFKELLFSNAGESHVATTNFNANYRLAEDDNVYLDVTCYDISIIEKSKNLGKESDATLQQLAGTISFSFLLQSDGLQLYSVTFSNPQLAEFCLNKILDEKRELEAEIRDTISGLQKKLSTSKEPEEIILSGESQARLGALDSCYTKIDHIIDQIYKSRSEKGDALIKTMLTYIQNSLANLLSYEEDRLTLNAFDELMREATSFYSSNKTSLNKFKEEFTKFNTATFAMAEHRLSESLKLKEDTNLNEAAINLINKLKTVDNPKDLPKLTDILSHANSVITNLTEENATSFEKKSEKIGKLSRPWGRMAAGAMLILLGVVVVGLGAAVTAATYGAALPFLVGGIVASAALVGTGITTAGFGSTRFFKLKESKPFIKKETEHLVDALSSEATPPSDSELTRSESDVSSPEPSPSSSPKPERP